MPKPPPETAIHLLERVVHLYARTFEDVPEGRTYLERRGITNAGLYSQFRLGFAAGTLTNLLPRNGCLKDDLRTLGILLDDPANGSFSKTQGESGQPLRERFAGSVVFPVYDAEGLLTTLCGIPIGNDSCMSLYLPGRPTGIWNAAAMKMYPDIILVGSVIDALSVKMTGLGNVMALAGPGGLSDTDASLLKAHGVSSVRLLFTGEQTDGGEVAKLLSLLESHSLAVSVMSFPAGQSPNTFLMEQGVAKLAEFIASATSSPGKVHGSCRTESKPIKADMGAPVVNCTGVTLTCGPRRYEVRGLEKGPRRLKATIRVEHGGRLHVDTLDFYLAKSRRALALDLCRVFEATPEMIGADLDKLVRHCEALSEKDLEVPSAVRPVESLMSPAEKKEAEAFGKSRTLFEDILSDFETCGLVGERANKLLAYLAMTSRKMDDPLSMLIVSSSGSGKTALQDKVLSLCPPEDLVKLTSLSSKALFYKEQMSLRHKALSLEEGAGATAAGYAIRNLITARELVIEVAIKDKGTGRITTMTNRVEGPTAVFITTTDPDTDPETRSRFFVTGIDESREQTRAILSFQRRRYTMGGLADRRGMERVLRKHHNLQRLLQPLDVVNPYSEQLTYGDDRLQGRRDQPKYLNLIKAVAFLRQGLKTIMTSEQGREYIRVEVEDIRLANELAVEILGMSLDELSTPGRDLLLQIEAMVAGLLSAEERGSNGTAIIFTRREVREFSGWANARIHRYMRELVDFEHVVKESGRNGVTCRYRLMWAGQGRDGSRFVPGVGGVDGLGLKPVEELKTP